ncbi:MAG: patatin-like phospholipase family protein [Alphaproteobacteria bacterium]|nr:patatin-like phospholipase family protein [Alphaproteobacteria bacterium]
MKKFFPHSIIFLSLLLTSGCISSPQTPLLVFSTPLTGKQEIASLSLQNIKLNENNDTLIMVSFSGGGTRAAAFAHGVMKGMMEQKMEVNGKERPVINKVRAISGVSGGAVAAAYFGLYGKEGIKNFRENFLLRDAEEDLHTSAFNPLNLLRASRGGVNNSSEFGFWLDNNLFFGATMADVLKSEEGKPMIMIHASDILNRTPFFFSLLNFTSFCADLRSYPLSQAVAASSAFPLAFRPALVKTFPSECRQDTKKIINERTRKGDIGENLHALFKSMDFYSRKGGELIHLFDGGIVDNLALHQFLFELSYSEEPYQPLTSEAIIKLRNLIVFSVNASRRTPEEGFALNGFKKGQFLFEVSISASLNSNSRTSFDLLKKVLIIWKKNLIKYRCSLPSSEIKRVRGTMKGWDCKDLNIKITQINTEPLRMEDQRRFDRVPTSFVLLPEDIDFLIWAGQTSLNINPIFKELIWKRSE